MRLIALVVLSRFADLSSTYWSIRRGATELNPIGRVMLDHPLAAALLELVGVPVYLVLLAYSLQRIPIAAADGLSGEQRRDRMFRHLNLVVRIFIAAGFAVAAWNLIQGVVQ